MPDRLWKPTVAELPASECAIAMVESAMRTCGSIAHSLTLRWRVEQRPFVGLVEVDVVERNADAQRTDRLDRVFCHRRGGGWRCDGFGLDGCERRLLLSGFSFGKDFLRSRLRLVG